VPTGADLATKRELVKELYDAMHEVYPFPDDTRIFLREWPLDSVSQNGLLGSGPTRPVFIIHVPKDGNLDAKRTTVKKINAAVTKAYQLPNAERQDLQAPGHGYFAVSSTSIHSTPCERGAHGPATPTMVLGRLVPWPDANPTGSMPISLHGNDNRPERGLGVGPGRNAAQGHPGGGHLSSVRPTP
jgi:hypothetical protein